MCKCYKEKCSQEKGNGNIEHLLGRILEVLEEHFEMMHEKFEEKEQSVKCFKKMFKKACLKLEQIEEHLDFFPDVEEEEDEEETYKHICK